MTPEDEPPAITPESGQPPSERRIAFERLRERTDELELIISGISLVALVTLPGWLFERLMILEPHAEGPRAALTAIGLHLGIGLSYTLAGAFLVHLAVRAYWVGLIGVKAAFPEGIRWSKVRSMGPVSRAFYARRLVGLDDAIDSADRFASIVFMLVSLLIISTLWIGMLVAVILGLASALAESAHVPDAVARGVMMGALIVVTGLPVLVLILDRGLMSRLAAGSPLARRFAPAVEFLVRIQGVILPQRFLLPVQLSLEANLPRHVFAVAFGVLITSSALVGHLPRAFAPQFAVFGNYEFMTDSDVETGVRSAHYENLRAADDRTIRGPLIPSDMIADSHLRVFLPHLPDRDNALLRESCPDAVRSEQRRACVAHLWTIELDGHAVDADSFVFSERRDLGLRGLLGYVSMTGAAPGRHELSAVWNAAGGTSGPARRQEYRIPFWFSPGVELEAETEPAPPES